MEPSSYTGKYRDDAGAIRSHACNCIGCCRKCGQCRTAPWHAQSCDAVADAQSRIRGAISDAGRLAP